MRTASDWFELYGKSHQNPINKAIHWICIPVIVVTTLGLFQAIPHPFGDQLVFHWGTLVYLAALVFYARLSWSLLAGMALFGGVALGINAGLEAAGVPIFWFSAITFFVAWVFQFIGHKIEGEKPSFFQDLQFLLVGPAWLLHFLYQRLGIRITRINA